VQTCQVCALTKPCRFSMKASLKPLPVPNRPGGLITLDLLSGLDNWKKEHTIILVAVDRFCKLAIFYLFNREVTSEKIWKVVSKGS
jgi:hypothetical protein